MSKHSKWAKIKRQKGATDVKRGIVFTRLSRAITIAAREGADPASNFKLRIAIDRALTENMPKDNIQRAVDRGSGANGEAVMESLMIEAKAIAGSALLIEVATDNHNRSFSEIRKILTDAGCAPTEPGSLQWLFERKGQVVIENVQDLETAELDAIDAGATDIDSDENTVEILCSPDSLHTVMETLKCKNYSVTSAQLMMNPKTPVPLPDMEYNRLQQLIETLEEHEDVVAVTTNAVPENPN